MEKIILHEKYSPISEANDIALLKVTPPVVCGRLIGPGCLPQFKAGPPRAAQTCWVAGWGFLKETGEYGRAGGPLRLIRLVLFERGTCGCPAERLCSSRCPFQLEGLGLRAECPVRGHTW